MKYANALGWLVFLGILFKLLIFGEDPNNPFTLALKQAGIYGWFIGVCLTVIVCGLTYAWRTNVRTARMEERLREMKLQQARELAAHYERARNPSKGDS